MHRVARVPVAFLSVAFPLVTGCAAQRAATPTPAQCAPPPAELASPVHTSGLAGEYTLTLVATSGPESGGRVSGALRLSETDADHRKPTSALGGQLQGVAVPYHGTADIELEQVGALRLGDPGSEDPDRPGVAWIEERPDGARGPESITLRLGSLANRSDVQAFDGGFTALYVTDVSAGRFAGTWASGVTGRSATGYFCAEPVK